MSRHLVGSVIVLALFVAVPLAYGEPRRGGGERSEGERSEGGRSGGERSGNERSESQSARTRKPPGGSWSEYNPEGKEGKEQFGKQSNESGAEGAAAGHAAEKNKDSGPSGAEGAAAGAAHSNRNQPQASAAEGAAAGAAAENRNAPKASGAQGAAAGAAVSNRNNPQYSGAQGAAAGAAAANRNAPKYSGAQGAAAGAAIANNNAPATSGAAGYAAVRNNVNHPGMYSQQWYGDHQSAWAPGGWTAATPWTPATWSALAETCNYGNSAPVSYNYGDNVTCVGGNVVVNGQPAGTAEDFSREADILAEDGAAATTAPTDKWMPLGVFALVRNEKQHPQLIMQLAVNQQGVLRGNYTDEVTDSTLPVHGAVDPKTKRAAWTIGDNRYAVMEAGLQNLTQSEASALLHKNGTTQRWLLVRLDQSSQPSAAAPAFGTP